jgi:hypothetical protein
VRADLVSATTAAVAAAAAGSAAAFEPAVADLSTVDPPASAVVLGWVVRALLEDRFPSDPDAADLRGVLTGCVSSCATWDSGVDPAVLLTVLTGALGVAEATPLDPAAVVRNAALLIAHLLGPRPLAPWLDAAVAELRRAETIELP